MRYDGPEWSKLLAVLTDMEALGDNCEFGAVQQAFGIDRLGLFRWSSATLGAVVRLLETRFDQLDDLDALDVFLGASGEAYLRNARLGFSCHCGRPPSSDPGRHLWAEWARLRLLKRKMTADLTSGERLFVYKGPEAEGGATVEGLARAVAAYGPGEVLWVSLAERTRDVGRVRRLGPNLMQGLLDAYAPPERVMSVGVTAWGHLAIAADGLRRSRTEEDSPPSSSWGKLLRALQRSPLTGGKSASAGAP